MKKRFFMLLVLAVVTLLAMCSTAMAASIPVEYELGSYATEAWGSAILYCKHPECEGKQILLEKSTSGGTCVFLHYTEEYYQGDEHYVIFKYHKEEKTDWKCNEFCLYCGRPATSLYDYNIIKEIDHAYDGIADFTNSATCIARAKVYDKCENGCGVSKFLYEEGEINPNAHKFYSWNYVVDGAPTCTTPGTKTATCSWCKTATDTIADPDRPALNHIPGAAADCTSPQVCTRPGCGEVLQPATGHSAQLTHKYYTWLTAERHLLEATCPDCEGVVRGNEPHSYNKNWHNGTVCQYCHTDANEVKHDWLNGACSVCDEGKPAPEPTPVMNGLNPDDGWYYIDGEKSNFTGLVKYDTGLFYVENGQWQKNLNGLKLIGEDFWFLAGGQVQEHHGFALYDGEWFYLDGGKLDVTASGVYEYNGKSFLVAAGRLVSECTGLAQVPAGDWYYVAEGRVLTEFSGEIEYDGKLFQIGNGKLVA